MPRLILKITMCLYIQYCAKKVLSHPCCLYTLTDLFFLKQVLSNSPPGFLKVFKVFFGH